MEAKGVALPSKYPLVLPNQLYLNRQYTKNCCLLGSAACGATAPALASSPDPVPAASAPTAAAHTAASPAAATPVLCLITERLANKRDLVKTQ